MKGGRAGRPTHHAPDGRYRNPWETPADRSLSRALGVFRWMWDRWWAGIPPNPDPTAFPRGESRIAYPRTSAGECRITWVGHSTALIQIAGLNILTDPHWSQRAAPFQWIGPQRLAPPGVELEALPPIDVVLLSHDHYDHLDDGTVRRLVGRFGEAITWFAPLGYRDWLARRGASTVIELDWWQEHVLHSRGQELHVQALPAQHWTKRGLERQDRLWASWAVRPAGSLGVYFGGDSGYFAGYREIGRRSGPFDVYLLPIGAYEPRWMMAPDHMSPEEAVRAYRDLGGDGLFIGIHWGTFRLTDEDPLEPPERAREAWADAGLPINGLWIPKHGETRIVAQACSPPPIRRSADA